MTALLVALGGAGGATARHLMLRAAGSRLGGFPWVILAANVIGSVLLGVLVGAEAGTAAYAVLAIGFCGALSTWSTLALDVWALLENGQSRVALADLLGSIVLGLAAVAAGLLLGGTLR